MKNKKIFGKLLIAFFIIMLVLTYASSQIYTAGLPKVTLGTPTSGDITSTYITQGTMHYVGTEDVIAPIDCTIEYMMCRPGALITPLTSIAHIDAEEFMLAQYDLEIQLKNYDAQMNNLDTNEPEYKKLAILRKRLADKLDKIYGMAKYGSEIVGGGDGMIVEVIAQKGQKVKAGDVLLRYVPNDRKQMAITWTMDRSEAKGIFKGNEVLVTFSGAVETSTGLIDTTIIKKSYKIAEKDYLSPTEVRFTAYFDESEVAGKNVDYGEGYGVSLRVVSSYSGYDHIIPIGAIDAENDCIYMIRQTKKLFRTESTVVSYPIRVIVKNEEKAAVASVPEGEIVFFSDVPIRNGDIVHIMDE